MSRRSFARHFKAATGATPHAWLLSQRLSRAEELLETTTLPIEQIADRVGYRSAAVFREQFTARRGVPPRDYRQTFRTMVLAVSGTYRRPASRQHAGREPEPGIMRAARNTTTPMPGTPNRQVRFALRYRSPRESPRLGAGGLAGGGGDGEVGVAGGGRGWGAAAE